MIYQFYLDGTYHILIFFIILLIVIPIIFLLIKIVDKTINLLNKIECRSKIWIKTLPRIGLVVSISLLIISEIFMGFRALRQGDLFWIYAALAFVLLPFFYGFIALYSYVLKKGEFKMGNAFLLFVSFSSFGWVASNVHDVIWCGVVTEFYTISHHAGEDLAFWYWVFGITDRAIFDYRAFGTYMFLSVLVEISVGTLAYYKFYKLNRDVYQKNKNIFLLNYVIVFCNSVFLGFVIAALDFGWVYGASQLAYFAFMHLTIGGIVFSFNGLVLCEIKKKKEKIK